MVVIRFYQICGSYSHTRRIAVLVSWPYFFFYSILLLYIDFIYIHIIFLGPLTMFLISLKFTRSSAFQISLILRVYEFLFISSNLIVGNEWSYQLCPRALIFAREAPRITDFDDFKVLLFCRFLWFFFFTCSNRLPSPFECVSWCTLTYFCEFCSSLWPIMII